MASVGILPHEGGKDHGQKWWNLSTTNTSLTVNWHSLACLYDKELVRFVCVCIHVLIGRALCEAMRPQFHR